MNKFLFIFFLSTLFIYVVIYAKPVNANVYGIVEKPQKKIALTFDACMTYGMEKKLKSGKAESYYNKAVIDELTKENIEATLFLTGLWAKNYPEVTKSLSQNPLFEIANHSYSHPSFTNTCFGLPHIKESDKENEFKMSQEILTNLTGKTPSLFRFPGGCYGKKIQI